MQTAPVSRACGCAAFLTTAAVDEAKGPAAMARGNSSCTSLSVEYVGKRRDESRPGTACRAPTFLNPTLMHGEQAERSNGGPIVCFDRPLVRNPGYASRDESFAESRLTAVGRQSGGWIVLLTSACRHRWSLSGWAWGTTSRGGHRAGGRARRPGCSSWCRSRKRLARSSKNQSLLIFPARNGI